MSDPAIAGSAARMAGAEADDVAGAATDDAADGPAGAADSPAGAAGGPADAAGGPAGAATGATASAAIESQLQAIDAATGAIAAAYQLVSTLTIASHVRIEHADQIEREIAGPLREAISDTIAKLGSLEAALDSSEPSAWDIVEHALDCAPVIDHVLNDDLWQHVAEVCFAARGELRYAERTIGAASMTHEQQLAACEGAHRKLRRALAAVLGALGRARDRTFLQAG